MKYFNENNGEERRVKNAISKILHGRVVQTTRELMGAS